MTSIDIPHPRAQSRLFGFDATEAELAEQFHAGKLHHSLMITGPKGIGKATLAYRFARFVLSGGADLSAKKSDGFSLFGPEPVAINEGDGALYMPPDHGIFKRCAGNSHSDLLSIEPAFDTKKCVWKDEIQAEAARTIIEFLSLTSAEAMHRVVIIDAADQLNEKAANALLKSIEEPPNNAFVVIVCHNPLSILPTIRSRCRVVKLQTPNLEDFSAVLAHIAPHVSLADYDGLHALSHGSPGFALHIAEHNGIHLYHSILALLAQSASQDALLELAHTLAAKKTADGWNIVKHVLLTALEHAIYPSSPHANAQVTEWSGIISKCYELRTLLAMRERAMAILRETDTLNLEHTQAIIESLKAA